jgi:GT2 family glycosyltransferase
MTDIVIPVRDELHYTQAVVSQILEEEGWNNCLIYDNGSVDGTPEFLKTLDERFLIIDAAGLGIYEMWSAGLEASTADYVAILNNDIILGPRTFTILAEIMNKDEQVWIAYPEYQRHIAQGLDYKGPVITKGTYRHGGLSGWAFMVRREKMDWRPWIDPALQWYGGDDDIVFETEKRGGLIAKAMGLPLDHYTEGTSRFHDALHEQKARDMAYLRKKWNK